MFERLRMLVAGTLRRQLIAGVALVHAVLMAGFVWDLTLRQQDMLLERQSEQAQALAASLATTSAGGLAARDLAGLVEIVDALGGYPDFAYAMIMDREGRVLAHSDPGRVGQFVRDLPVAAQPVLLARTHGLVDAVTPITLAQRHIGWARVGLNEIAARQRLAGIVRDGVLYALVAIAVGSLLAAWMGGRLTRRLSVIQGVADAVERGEQSQRAALAGTDEAARLARAFDRMLDGQAAAHQALADSEQRLLVAMDAASMVAWHWDIGADRTTWSDERQRLLGPCPAEGYSDYRQMVVPQDRELFLGAGRAALAGSRAYVVEYRLRRTDGRVIWVLTQGRVLRNAQGQPVAMTGVSQDITERKRIEELLHQSEQRANLIFDSSPDALLVVGEDGRILRVNSQAAPLFGYSNGELIGQSIEALVPEGRRGVHPGLRAGYAHDAVSRTMAKNTDVTARRRDGGEFPVAISLSMMAEGDEMQVIASVRDETHAKALEAELIRHRDHLEEMVAARTVELSAARNEAERLARVKSEFLANMSHEIRTPLNAVLGLAQIAVSDEAARASPATFNGIVQAGQHLLGVINDILDFSKIDAGKLIIERKPFALAAALAGAGSFVVGAAQQKGLAFEMTCAPDLPEWVSGDARRLQQILVNLLANAVKFTDRGVVRLRVAREGDDTYFKVIDAGIGMHPGQVERLFQPFEQGDSSTTRRYGGTGLGLAISRDLARQMGGEIMVDSAPGAGSSFTLRLPLPATEPGLPAGPAPAGQRLAGLRLLAAEDVDVNRLILEALLIHEGASAVFAEDGQQALDRLGEAGADAFDAVLMDVQMPVMDGFDAARRIREIAPRLPVIALTAHALDAERENCRAAGMVEHVTKPIVLDELVAAILRQVGPTA